MINEVKINARINRAEISVRLVHIDGPRKGDIDKKKNSIIQIGRHPDCDVLYPPSERSISRKHAQIIRTGNRFRLLNQSPNGCYVNGQLTQSTFLHNGDVLMFSKDGPKLSFLYSLDQPTGKYAIKAPVCNTLNRDYHANEKKKWQSITFDEKQKTETIIQYGTKIHSFNQHVIKIGRHFNNDIVIRHPLIMEQHAEIRYQHNNFFIQGVFQKSIIYLNKRLISDYTRLIKNDLIHLGKNGPCIRYLGTARFMEVLPQPVQATEDSALHQDHFLQDKFSNNNNTNNYNQPL